MRSPREIFWKNDARSGAENLCEEDDPQKTCVAMHAGEFKSEAEANRLGILQYLYGGGAEGRQAGDAEAMSQHAMADANEVRQHAREHYRANHPPSVEERAYVENAVGSGAVVTPAERQAAGEMGGTYTGPTLQEQAQAGSYQEAAARGTEQMGPGQVETPASQAQQTGHLQPAGEEPKPPDTPPSGRSVPRKD